MLSWILVGVLYLCGIIAGEVDKTKPKWAIIPMLLAWPLVIIVGTIFGGSLVGKGTRPKAESKEERSDD